MAAMAADDPGRTVIYAVTPMGMCVAAEGMAFLARRIVVHQDGRDAEAEAEAATVVRALAYHRARAANHPSSWVRKWSDRTSWRLARKVGVGDASLGARLLDVQRDRLTSGADAVLAAMFTTPANQHEAAKITVNRLGSDLHESAPEAPPVTAELPAPESAESVPTARDRVLKSLGLPIEPPPTRYPPRRVPESAPRRATGRVPQSARTPRPTRDSDELLDEARSVTAKWSDGELTAEAIRKAVRTSSANGRLLRDTLKAERAAEAEATAA